MRLIMFASLFCLIVAGSAISAQCTSVGLFRDPTPATCGMPDDGPGMLSIYVVMMYSPGVTGLQFSAPLPECWEGAPWISDTSHFITIGNSQTGIAIALGSCLPSPVHVLTINVMTSGLVNACCPYPVLPDPSLESGEIEVIDCGGNVLIGNEYTSFVTSDGSWAPPLVHSPEPSDGAVGQPLEAKLSWRIQQCSCGLGVVWNTVFFGTTPDPPMVAQYLDPSIYDPGSLAPATTYYWRVGVYDSDAGTTESPIWAFTTGSAVPAAMTSWGRVKALYNGDKAD
ncbi:MAG: hypothetical protein GTO42_01185 [Candidatus Latescibacteria bacterium]|nr:hypothetical protein [Candidatus Latescibacterota bacterium]NIO27143.1 hypothetical protein [Candidatus Latescibacterota bacterium]NIO54667.1 hypothetical protein [Candidatus Latescibacterota bacterium]NIT00750.1 hypothetical protein [Candidatus Latescibacterota bacterium]NIT37673.1 hypothetical protein [Candidatus Latescibacterota bacterium]